MYGKEAGNRKQEIDRQHHTIPNKRPKKTASYTPHNNVKYYEILLRFCFCRLTKCNEYVTLFM